MSILGAIAGDIIGSVYEWNNIKIKQFPLFSPLCTFTDDSVLTCALADSLMANVPYCVNLKHFYRLYPDRGYGGHFHAWAQSEDSQPYNSWGNGAPMRVSPVAYWYDRTEDVRTAARASAEVTHNHPEGVRGAVAIAECIFAARQGLDKNAIVRQFHANHGYEVGTLDEIRPMYEFDVSSQGTVGQAVQAFAESTDYEDAIRNAISLGGDSDTLACITGSVAGAYYGVPQPIRERALGLLDPYLADIVLHFEARCTDLAGR